MNNNKETKKNTVNLPSTNNTSHGDRQKEGFKNENLKIMADVHMLSLLLFVKMCVKSH